MTLYGRAIALTNLNKTFFPQLGLSKGDLLRYYLRVAPAVLPDVGEGDGHEALPARGDGGVLFHETSTVPAAAVDPHL